MAKKSEFKRRPGRPPKDPTDDYFQDEPVSYLYRHIIVACILFAFAALFYLAYSNQAGLLGEWFLTNSRLLAGTVGFYLIPSIAVGLGITQIIYKHDPVPLHVPVGTTMVLVGTLTTLYVIDPTQPWSGYLGTLIGEPLLIGSGTYIAALAATALALAGVFVLPRGKDLLALIGHWFERGAGSIAVGASRLIRNRRPSFATSAAHQLNESEDEPDSDEEYYEEEVDEQEEDATPDYNPTERSSKRSVQDIDKVPEPVTKKAQLPASPYIPPPLNLLAINSGKANVGDIQHNAAVIKSTLANFNIGVEMDEISTGPSITRYTMKPSQGLKLSRILQLRNELSLALASHPLRIEAPIPGQSLVGIEIPNRAVATVGLRTLLEETGYTKSTDPLTVAMGRGVSGKPFFANIAKIPHLMIAGTTGSGKSVAAHNIILSLLYRNGPDNLKLILVDPKRVELTLYNGIPHLLTPVIKEAKKAIIALRWAAKEMDRRYHVLEREGVRDIGSYHQTIVTPAYEAAEKIRARDPDAAAEIELPERMPYIVIMIDELADIMQAYPRELESGIVRLAQMSRAVGMHLIIATQRPEVRVITGLIKANVPGRMALRVASRIDSQTILDAPGAETLLGKGDMLFLGEGMNKPERIQSAFVSEDEIKKIVANIVQNNRGFLVEHIDIGDEVTTPGAIVSMSFSESMDPDSEDDDTMYAEARDLVIKTRVASTSYIQRKLRVGYSRAARLIDILEDRGVIGPSQGSRPREVLIGGHDTEPDYEENTEPDE
jgi:S-DNA-T family DNA segregation ATPase FtsK/SpoIIIE